MRHIEHSFVFHNNVASRSDLKEHRRNKLNERMLNFVFMCCTHSKRVNKLKRRLCCTIVQESLACQTAVN